MGQLHTKVYRSMLNVKVIGLAECDTSKKDAFEKQFNVPAYEAVISFFQK